MAQSFKRKDSRGRILRKNEQQRKDGQYMYTYKDPTTGKRMFIYSWKLERNDKTPAGKKIDLSLREKEKLIEKDLRDGISYQAGGVTVLELVERYISLKTKVRPTTRAGYKTVVNVLKEDAFGKKKIADIKTSEAKRCRSPMAQMVLQDMVNRKGLSGLFRIDSRATSTEEIGNPPHRGTVRKLKEAGIPLLPHKAARITQSDYMDADYIIGMDTWNMRNLSRMFKGDPEGKLYKLLTCAGSDRDIADPWYTGDFDVTYEDIVEGCEGFLKHLKENREI